MKFSLSTILTRESIGQQRKITIFIDFEVVQRFKYKIVMKVLILYKIINVRRKSPFTGIRAHIKIY